MIVGNSGYGGGLYVAYGAGPLVAHNEVTGNAAPLGLGGGISLYKARGAEIRGNVVSRNKSGYGGGGIGDYGSHGTLFLSNVISDNETPRDVGGGLEMIYVEHGLVVGNVIARNKAVRGGGGIAWYTAIDESTRPILVNNMIVDNEVEPIAVEGYGGSEMWSSGYTPSTFRAIVNNVIVSKRGPAIYCVNPAIGEYRFAFNDVFSEGGSSYAGACDDETGRYGNLAVDPRFADRVRGDYHLRAASPLVDRGDNAAPHLPLRDVDGDLRILDGNGDGTPRVDIGADEVRPSGPPRSSP